MSEVAAAVVEPTPAPEPSPAGTSPAPGVAPITPRDPTNRERAAAKAKEAMASGGTFSKSKEDPEADEKKAEPSKKEPAKTKGKPSPEEEARKSEEKAAAEKLAAEKEAEQKAKEDEAYRKLRQKQKRIKAEQEQLAADRAEIARHKAEREADERLKKESPHEWLEKHKFDFRDVAKRAVAEDIPPEEKAAREEAEAWKKELQELRDWKKKSEAAEQEREQKAATAQVQADAKREYEAAKGRYPSLAKYHTAEEVAEAAAEIQITYYRKTRREADIDDVFAHLEKRAKTAAERYSAKENAERAERATAASDAGETRAAGRPTVTNRDSATRAAPDRKLTAEERRQRAIDKVNAHWTSSH